MSVQIARGKSDPVLEQVMGALQSYARDHLAARIDLYRQNRFSIRVRVIDPGLAGLSVAERNDLVWQCFDGLPDDIVSDITMVLPVTPDELPLSGANLEFDDPVEQVLL